MFLRVFAWLVVVSYLRGVVGRVGQMCANLGRKRKRIMINGNYRNPVPIGVGRSERSRYGVQILKAWSNGKIYIIFASLDTKAGRRGFGYFSPESNVRTVCKEQRR